MLTAAEVKNARAESKRRKMSDGRGLLLIVDPSGGKWWRYRYKHKGRERLMSLGVYPTMTLSQARVARDKAATLRAAGVDPMAQESETSGDTLEQLAKDWFDAKSTNWTTQNATRVWARIRNNVLPRLGGRDPDALEPRDILEALKLIEDRGAIETAHRVRGYISSMFRFGIASQRVTRDPAADVRDALKTKPTTVSFAAITDPDTLAVMLKNIHEYRGRWWAVSPAARLTPYLLVRPGTLRRMEWSDVDLERAEWQTKSLKGERLETIVPLPRQAVGIISSLEQWSGKGRYVFPGPRSVDRPLSENAIAQALRGMGWGADQVTAHGFRATARTMLDEVLQWRVDWVESQLGHNVKDPNGRAYNRTKFLDERRAMMQAWADYLDALRIAGRSVDPSPHRQVAVLGHLASV